MKIKAIFFCKIYILACLDDLIQDINDEKLFSFKISDSCVKSCQLLLTKH